MPTYSNTPPDPDEQRALPIRRTPTNGQLRAAITTDDLIGTPTHFYGGHTVPCEPPNCEACGKGIPWTWHGYVAAIQAGSRLHFIFEFTAQVGQTFRDYYDVQSTLRGCLFTAERMHHRPNGRVIITLTPGDLAVLNLPRPPDMQACLGIIWHIPSTSSSVSRDVNNKPIIRVDSAARIVAENIGSQRKSNGKGS